MYAVIETGGKQYRVELGTELEIDRLEAAPGETIELGRVLLLADGDDAQIGRPVVDGATVSASVVRQDRGDKIVVFKYRPKARTRVKRGHRQDLTVVRIADITFNGRSAAKEAQAQAKEAEAERKAAEEAAAKQAAADKALADKLERERKAAEEAAAEEAAEEKKAAKPTRSRKKTDESEETKAGDGAKAKADDAKDDNSKAKSGGAKAEAKAKPAGRPSRPTKTDESATNDKPAPKRSRAKKEE